MKFGCKNRLTNFNTEIVYTNLERNKYVDVLFLLFVLVSFCKVELSPLFARICSFFQMLNFVINYYFSIFSDFKSFHNNYVQFCGIF